MDDAISIFERLVADFPSVPQHRADLARCYNTTALLCNRLGQAGEVENYFSLEVDAYEKLVAEFPQRFAYRRTLALACSNLGISRVTRQPDEARKLQEQSLTLRRKLVEEHPKSLNDRSNMAISCTLVARLLPEEEGDQAEELFREAIQLGESLVRESPNIPDYQHKLAQSYRTLATELKATDPRQAETYFRKALASSEQLSAQYPLDATYRRNIAFTLQSFGDLLLSSGQIVVAMDSIRRGCDIMEQLVLDFEDAIQFRRDRDVFNRALGQALALTGKQNEGAVILQRVADQLAKLKEETPDYERLQIDLDRAHGVLARLYSNWMPAESRDQALALEHADKSMIRNQWTTYARTTLGIVRYQSGDWVSAMKVLNPQGDAINLLFISMCQSKLEDRTEAVRLYEKAVDSINDSLLINLEVQRYRRQAEALLGLPAGN